MGHATMTVVYLFPRLFIGKEVIPVSRHLSGATECPGFVKLYDQ